MPIKTAEEFLAVLERSNLLNPAEFSEAKELSREFTDAAQFAKTLIREEIITRWQAKVMLAGSSAFFLGKYKLITLLGRGGMGSVFLAEHVMMHRPVALKILPRSIAKNPDALDHFLSEARTVAALDHWNIVRAYSVDNEGDRYYLVMEYVDGLDLERVVEAKGPLDCESAVDCIRQAADGLAHAHARKMIHCDIKPSNLILNEQGVVKILDMGLARLVGRDQPDGSDASEVNKHILGSVDYLAPEQALAAPDFDHRADIYALGCTMYFLLTAHPPFPGGTLAQRIIKHQTQLPPEIFRERPDVPANLSAICMKMMAKDPADRYQTAAEVSDQLGDWQPQVPQPENKPTAINNIAKLTKEIRATSPWDLDFGDELKNTISLSGTNEFGLPANLSGTFPVLKNNPSSGSLAQLLAGTRGRLIFSSCMAAGFITLLLLGVIYSILHNGGLSEANIQRNQSGNSATQNQPTDVPPPAPQDASKNVSGDSSTLSPPKTSQTTETQKTENPAKPPETAPKSEPATIKPEDKTPPNSNPPTDTNPPTSPNPQPEVVPVTEPLKELASAVELSDFTESTGVSLGKVHLEADKKLQIELIGSERSSLGNGKYIIVEDSHATGGQAWNIMRNDPRNKVLLARIKIKGADLNFEWSPGANLLHANALKNCGILVSSGDANRFVQFRLPKSADPLKLDFESGIVKVSLPAENLPDPARLLLKIEELKEPFPVADIKPEAPVPGSQTKRMVQIDFTDPNLSLFSLRVNYDANKQLIGLDASGALSFAPKANFRSQSANDLLTTWKNGLDRNKGKLAKMKSNDPKLADTQKQVAVLEENVKKLAAATELAKKLNDKTIHYRIIAEYDSRQIEYFNSQLPQPKETATNAKSPGPQERPSEK